MIFSLLLPQSAKRHLSNSNIFGGIFGGMSIFGQNVLVKMVNLQDGIATPAQIF